MSNEEILEKYANERIFDNMLIKHEKKVMSKVIQAMDAARRDEAIAFHLWVLDSEWRLNPHCKENKWRTIEQIKSSNYTQDGITTEQLYQLFKNNQP